VFSIPAAEFVAFWAASATLAEVVEHVCARAGDRVPRWAVLGRAITLRAAGTALKTLPDENPARASRSATAGVLATARELARRLMAAHGLTAWAFAFNTNVRRAGVCRYPAGARPGRIELSRHFVQRNPEAEVRDTILHEIAHALIGPRHGHDAVWKAKCVEIGARPERCFGGAVEMPPGRWRATCPGCRKVYDRHRRPPRPAGWYCKPCGPGRGGLVWCDVG